ncbi:MAG: hypothetical protein ABR991_11440 [Terracidiphilus sp.]|jgi:hypothetical protein
MRDLKKVRKYVRLNDLARELEIKTRTLLDLLPGIGISRNVNHASSLSVEEAMAVISSICQGEITVDAKSLMNIKLNYQRLQSDLLNAPNEVQKIFHTNRKNSNSKVNKGTEVETPKPILKRIDAQTPKSRKKPNIMRIKFVNSVGKERSSSAIHYGLEGSPIRRTNVIPDKQHIPTISEMIRREASLKKRDRKVVSECHCCPAIFPSTLVTYCTPA